MMRSKRAVWPAASAVLLANVLVSTASAAILQDCQFNDPNGTTLADAENSVPLGGTWNEDEADMMGSSVQDGVYRIQKDNEAFGTNFLDIDNVTSGKAWLVTEIAGWNFTPTLGTGEVAEEIRFAFLNNDGGGQGGSMITGQTYLQRNAAGNIELVGQLLTSGPDFGPLPLTHTRNTPFTIAVEIDEDAENYSVYYKDDDDPFTLLGTAPHVAGRDGNSIRFVANNDFGGAGEFFDIDRIYLTDEDPTNVAQDRLTLQVNTVTGEMMIRNDTASTFDIDSYRITSDTNDLNLAGWESLSSKVPLVDPVDGPDGGTTLGDGTGETWDEAPGSNDSVLAESFLLGSSVFNPDREESLGNAFQIGGNADPEVLKFQYRNADTGAIVFGDIEAVSVGPDADFDGDGDVDGSDFLRWQRGFGLAGQTDNSNGDADGNGTVNGADLAAWESQFGSGTGSLSAAQTVPEPGTLVLVLASLALAGFRRR